MSLDEFPYVLDLTQREPARQHYLQTVRKFKFATGSDVQTCVRDDVESSLTLAPEPKRLMRAFVSM
jgi:hypothetical protein